VSQISGFVETFVWWSMRATLKNVCFWHFFFKYKYFTFFKIKISNLCETKWKKKSSSDVRAIPTRATGARPRHRRICKSSLLKSKHWRFEEIGTHGPRPEKLMRLFSDLLYVFFAKWKCFRNKSESVFWNENEIVFETRMFIWKPFAKRKCFRNESKIVFETKRF